MDIEALQRDLSQAVSGNDLEKAKWCLDNGADVNYVLDYGHILGKGWPELFRACFNSNKEMAELLLSRGANPNAIVYPGGVTIAHEVVKSNKMACASILAEYGADFNKKDEFGRTPLNQLTIQKTNAKIIEKLLKLGANPRIKDGSNWSMLDRAMSIKERYTHWKPSDNKGVGELELANIIIDHVNHVIPKHEIPENKLNEAFLKAARNGSHKMLKECIVKGADLNYTDKNDNNALFLSAIKGSIKCLNILLENGMDAFYANDNGETMLHLAAGCGHIDFVKFLIDIGLDINQQTSNKDTAAMYSMANNNDNVEMLDFLVKNGADIRKFSYRHGDDCFNIALKYGNIECVKYFINNGFDINRHSDNIYPPVSIAARALSDAPRNHIKKINRLAELVDFLVKKGADINVTDKYDMHILKHVMCSGLDDENIMTLIKSILCHSRFTIALNENKDSIMYDSVIDFAEKRELYGIANILKSYKEMTELQSHIDHGDEDQCQTIQF